MNISAAALPALVIVTLVGCITDQTAHPRPSDAEPTELSHEARVIETKKGYEANLAKWEAAKVADYAMKVNMECYCFPGGGMEVSVVGRVPARVNSISEHNLISHDFQLELAPTVATLFRIIKNHLGDPDYSLEVKYHRTLGYPVRLELRNLVELRDADVIATVMALEPR